MGKYNGICFYFLNFSLAADVVIFNSNYNRKSFLENVPKILKLLPDYRPNNVQTEIDNKSRVLYFPMLYPENCNSFSKANLLHIVWPHRWEFDKAPEIFFSVLYKLKDNNFKFIVSVLGECFQQVPAVFEEAKEILKDHIVNYGYIDDKTEYYKILSSAHAVVSTAHHEFFGVAM